MVEICADIDSEFETLYKYSENLASYATAFRYQDISLEPDYDEVLEAIAMAENILKFVEKKMV